MALERALPRRDREVWLTVPYERGDLISRAYEVGEVLGLEHGAQGTLIRARLPEWLAVELEQVAWAGGDEDDGPAPADGLELTPAPGLAPVSALTSANGNRNHAE